MFIILSRVGWRIFFYYYYYFSTAFQALILFHAYNVMFWLACGIMYYLPVCRPQFLLQ